MRPCVTLEALLSSASLASSTRRHCAKLRSSSESHLESSGKLGRMNLCHNVSWRLGRT